MTRVSELLNVVNEREEVETVTFAIMNKYGSLNWVWGGSLWFAPLMRDGSVDWQAAGEVENPETQEFLDDINDALYTHFKLDDPQFSTPTLNPDVLNKQGDNMSDLYTPEIAKFVSVWQNKGGKSTSFVDPHYSLMKNMARIIGTEA